MIKKIHIIGGPGSGKTFLAKGLGRRLDIQEYDLDNIFWCNTKNAFGIEAEPDVRDMELNQALEKDEWIIEGVYGGWTRPSFKAADVIIVLQPPTAVRQWRITRRFFRRRLLGKDHKKKETWKSFVGLLKWSKRYYAKNFPGISKQIRPFAKKTITITKPRITVDEIISKIQDPDFAR